MFSPFLHDDNFLVFHKRMNMLLGVMVRFVLYIQDFSDSPDETWDLKRFNYVRETYGPDDLFKLENAIYKLLFDILQNHAQSARIFINIRSFTHHCSRRIWLTLIAKYPLDQPVLRMKLLARTVFHIIGPRLSAPTVSRTRNMSLRLCL